MRIHCENTILMVIDIQEKLFPAMIRKEDFLKNTLLLIRGMQILQIPVIVTQQYTKGLGETIPAIKACFDNFDFIEKRDFSCCDEPEAMRKLKELEAGNIILCGIESHVCILQTAVDLKATQLNPVVAADAITSRSPDNVGLARERFRQESILMTSVESLLFELTRSSSSPVFRDISKLVKENIGIIHNLD
jgi:nicotinamidase-related amidase